MRARWVVPLVCLLASAGCVDAMLDDAGEPPVQNELDEPQESVAGNETTDDGAGNDSVLGPPIPGDDTTTPTPEPTPTTPLTPLEPAPTPPPATPPPATPPPATPPPATTTPTPPPPTPTPPPPTPTPPPPTPTPPSPEPQAWPHEGSFVRYRVTVFEGSPDGSYNAATFTNVTWTYTNGDWRGTCDGTRTEQFREDAPTTTAVHHDFVASDPPHWPLFNTRSPPEVGGDVTAWFMKGCNIQQLERRYAGTDTEPTTVNGQPTTADTFVATDYDDGSPDDFRTEWSRDSGLVEYWSWSQRHTSTRGDLVDTDAPM